MGSHGVAMALLRTRVLKPQLQEAIVKPPAKKSPMVLRTLALASSVICSFCIFSVLAKRPEMRSENHVVRKALHHTVVFNLSEKTSTLGNLSYVARLSSAGKRFPIILKKVNFTEVASSSGVRDDTTVKTLPQVVTIDSTEKTLPRSMRLYLTEKPSLDPKFRRSCSVDYNKTITNQRQMKKCMPVSLYAIVSMQRSGSKWFVGLLNSHKNVGFHGEIFYNVDRRCNMTVITGVLDRFFSLDWNTNTSMRKRKNCLVAFGFKWMLNQGIQDNHDEIVDYFNRNGVSAILLLRRNHLQRLAQILATCRPELNVKSLIPTLEYFKSTRHIVVYYEDLVQNQTKKMMEVLEFLRVPQRSLVSCDVKIHTSSMAQRIANWRAVVKVIRRSKFKRLIARTTKFS